MGLQSRGPSSSFPKGTGQPRLDEAQVRRHLLFERVVVPVVALVVGMGLGVLFLLLYALSLAGEGKVLVTPLPPPGGDIVVQVGPGYITRLVARNLQTAGLPGQIENVRVSLADSDRIHSAQLTINGDDQIGVLGIGITRHFTIITQLLTQRCQIQAHILHADLDGISVTSFVARFEGEINQQLQTRLNGLPRGFIYCTTGVRTKPLGLFIIYSATPVP